MIILGIDPGTASVGYGIIRRKNKRGGGFDAAGVNWGVIKTKPSAKTADRLKQIHRQTGLLLKKWRPDLVAVESIFFFKNAKTAIGVAQARGVILLAIAQKNLPLLELTPLQVKSIITGYGRADKKQIQLMIKALLRLKEAPKPDDAADALALAFCAGLTIRR